MSEKRDLMKRAGWTVHQRSSHMGPRWDFSSPFRGAMDSRILETEEKAWAEAEADFDLQVGRARDLVVVVGLGAYFVPFKLGEKQVGWIERPCTDDLRAILDDAQVSFSIGAG